MKACETSENGLSHEEIIKRHQQFGYNILDEKKKEKDVYKRQILFWYYWINL